MPFCRLAGRMLAAVGGTREQGSSLLGPIGGILGGDNE